MGVERAVTRWYVQRQAILHEIALLEAKRKPEPPLEESSELSLVAEDSDNEDTDIASTLSKAQEKLRLLGPCPKPMMG